MYILLYISKCFLVSFLFADVVVTLLLQLGKIRDVHSGVSQIRFPRAKLLKLILIWHGSELSIIFSILLWTLFNQV